MLASKLRIHDTYMNSQTRNSSTEVEVELLFNYGSSRKTNFDD